MEYMDKGSLDNIYKKIGPIDIDIVGQVAFAVLEGLTYLYDVHRIIHRGESERSRFHIISCKTSSRGGSRMIFSVAHTCSVVITISCCLFRHYPSPQISSLRTCYATRGEKSKFVILVSQVNL